MNRHDLIRFEHLIGGLAIGCPPTLEVQVPNEGPCKAARDSTRLVFGPIDLAWSSCPQTPLAVDPGFMTPALLIIGVVLVVANLHIYIIHVKQTKNELPNVQCWANAGPQLVRSWLYQPTHVPLTPRNLAIASPNIYLMVKVTQTH